FAYAFSKSLPAERTACKICCAQRIDTVESDAALPKQSRQIDDIVENLLPLLYVQLFLDAGAGEEWPAGRNPDTHLAAWAGSLACSQLIKRIHGILEAFVGTVNPPRANDRM